MNQDFVDLLLSFREHGVVHMIVGAFALAVHGVSRATGDINIWVRPDEENSQRVIAALRDFGVPLAAHGVTVATFSSTGDVYQFGLPPSRIDLLTTIDGVAFDEAWRERVMGPFGGLDVPVISLPMLRKNKASAGRPKDLADLALLDELHQA